MKPPEDVLGQRSGGRPFDPRLREAGSQSDQNGGGDVAVVLDAPRLHVDRATEPRVEAATVAGHWRRRLAGDSRGFVLRRLLAVSDVVGLLAAGMLTLAATGTAGVGTTGFVLFGVFLPVWMLIANALGLFHLADRRLGHSLADELGPVAFGLTLWSWALLLTGALFDPSTIELLPSAALWAFALVTLPAMRELTRVIARRRPWYQQRVAVIGTASDVCGVARRLRRHPDLGLEVVSEITIAPSGSLLSTNGHDGTAGSGSESGRATESRNGALAELIDVAQHAGVNRVVVASSPGDMNERSELIRTLNELRVHVDLVAADSDAIPARGSLHYIEGLPMLTIPAFRKTRSRVAFKRCVDVVAAGSGLLFLSPLLLYCAVRIRLGSPGPAIFRQERVGRGGKRFQMLKFRTMVADADSQKGELSEHNLHQWGDTPGMFKVACDPRVTRFGDRLRRWSVDELPQLWNVLRGDMSLVGPRPLIPDEACLVNGHFEARLNTRPGITGPWQTSGRSEIGFEDMLKLDYTYVMNWSFAEDVKILFRTCSAVLRRHGAY